MGDKKVWGHTYVQWAREYPGHTDGRTDGVTCAREGVKLNIHFYFNLHPLRNLQE